MKTVNMHGAKTNLSRLVDGALKGEPFVIARAGQPLVQVTMVQEAPPTRIGFLDGAYDMAGAEIAAAFDGASDADGGPA